MKRLASLRVKAAPWWRSGRRFGALVVGMVLAFYAGTDVLQGLDRNFYDFARNANPPQPSNQVVLVAIDEPSLARLGPWPWPRSLHARLIDKLAEAKPNVVVYTVPFFEPQRDPGLAFIQRIKAVLAQAPLQPDAAEGASLDQRLIPQQLIGLIQEAEAALDGDARLAQSLEQAGNVVLAANAVAGGAVASPIERLASVAAGVGYFGGRSDRDGVLRSEALLLPTDGNVLPSLALLAAASSLKLKASDIRVTPRQRVQIGHLTFSTGTSGTVLSQFYSTAHGQPAFATESFAAVLSGEVDMAKYADKVVIIGVTAPSLANVLAVSGHAAMSQVEALAHSTSSILQLHLAHEPVWNKWALWGSMVLAALFVALGLPLLSVGAATSLSLAMVLSLLALEFWSLSVMGLRLQLVPVASLLLVGYAAYLLRHLVLARANGVNSAEDVGQTDRMMGLALQGQGQLDMAFERFCNVPMHAALAQDLYCLGLDFERKQLFDKAQTVYARIASFDGAFKDVQGRMARLQSSMHLPDQSVAGVTLPTEPPDSIGLKMMLGRYEVEKELGKGAMGVVYLGKDPSIDRLVALKTMALGEAFDGDGLVDAQDRFFREAKAAGRLQHPSIVTIFDVGEAHGLAFIAMEYVKGQDLQPNCKRGALLPVPSVLSIVVRVAQALAYAYRLQVIHRDIKPGNVMYDLVTDTVKVTDFGIARITDGNKTRTGVVMGTPSYMSPEQLTGLVLDGRSDLYSLGIMAFQLLSGVLPFRADTMAELMSKIAKQEAPDLRQIRPEIPEDLAVMVARLLRKAPQDRYQDGDALAADLSAHLGRTRVDPRAAPELGLTGQGSSYAGSLDLEI
ncbi:MAG: serine/threonine-protein kinase [Rhodoferax sp.]|uniref:CHASE2 domain-containing serine/threonine-protein kinase n=1 Tax=Rhodoferax sp. TaxID=50421 RepID=UPI0026173621|nr:serine/threonine-protein kinase [Rhodoferax sp.]MDD2880576.1 serine/threonine-protein kinase [Rhodoferax sp.]